MNSDVRSVLLSLLENETLSALQQAGLGSYVIEAARQQLWWYNRANNLFSGRLKKRPGADWKSAYPFIESAHRELTVNPIINPFEYTFDNVLATEVFLELGYDPSAEEDQALFVAATVHNLDVMKLLLSDPRVNPGAHGNYPLSDLIYEGEIELAKSLLSDRRVDPGDGANVLLRTAAAHGQIEIMKMLLADPRVDINDGDDTDNPLMDAIENNQQEAVKLLLSDRRIDLENYDSIGQAKAVLSAEEAALQPSWFVGADAARLFLDNPRVVDHMDRNR